MSWDRTAPTAETVRHTHCLTAGDQDGGIWTLPVKGLTFYFTNLSTLIHTTLCFLQNSWCVHTKFWCFQWETARRISWEWKIRHSIHLLCPNFWLMVSVIRKQWGSLVIFIIIIHSFISFGEKYKNTKTSFHIKGDVTFFHFTSSASSAWTWREEERSSRWHFTFSHKCFCFA